jgi:hypothetical protein
VQDHPEDAELAELEDQLRMAAALIDPVPPRVVQAATDSFTWRTVDADLAGLIFDSLTDQDEGALLRGPEHGRLLSFVASGLTIDLRVARAGPSRRIIGQLVPPQQAAVELRHPGGVATLVTDDLGRFSSGLLSAGPISLRCSVGAKLDDRRVVTEWVSI